MKASTLSISARASASRSASRCRLASSRCGSASSGSIAIAFAAAVGRLRRIVVLEHARDAGVRRRPVGIGLQRRLERLQRFGLVVLLEEQPPHAVSTIAGSPPARSASRKNVVGVARTVERVRGARPRASSTAGSEDEAPCRKIAVEDRLGVAAPARSCDTAARAPARRRPPARARRSARAAPAPRGTCRASRRAARARPPPPDLTRRAPSPAAPPPRACRARWRPPPRARSRSEPPSPSEARTEDGRAGECRSKRTSRMTTNGRIDTGVATEERRTRMDSVRL